MKPKNTFSEETMNIAVTMTAIRALKEMQERQASKYGANSSYKEIASRLIIDANKKEAAK